MTTTSRREFVRDQVDAVAADLQVRARHLLPPGQRIGPQHEATRLLTARLIEELRGGLPLCEHLQGAPGRTGWAPSMPSLACFIDFVSFGAVTDGNNTCDLCVLEAKFSQLHGAAAIVGPIQIQAVLCGRCRNQPARGRYDARGVARTVVELVARRYEVRP